MNTFNITTPIPHMGHSTYFNTLLFNAEIRTVLLANKKAFDGQLKGDLARMPLTVSHRTTAL